MATQEELNQLYAQLAANAGTGNSRNVLMNALLRQQLAQQGADWQSMPGSTNGSLNRGNWAVTREDFDQMSVPYGSENWLANSPPGAMSGPGQFAQGNPMNDPNDPYWQTEQGQATLNNRTGITSGMSRADRIRQAQLANIARQQGGDGGVTDRMARPSKESGGSSRPTTGSGTKNPQFQSPYPGTYPQPTLPGGQPGWPTWNPPTGGTPTTPTGGGGGGGSGGGGSGGGGGGGWPTLPGESEDSKGWPTDPNVKDSDYPFDAKAQDALGVYGPSEQLWLTALADFHQRQGLPAYGGLPENLQYYGEQGDEYADRNTNADQIISNLSSWALGDSQGNALPGWMMQLGQNKANYTNRAGELLEGFEDAQGFQNVDAGNIGNAPRMNAAQLGDADILSGINMDTVAEIANNPYLSGQIDAVNRDIARSLTEAGLPQNAMQAAGSGNSGSTRRGVMDALLTRGTQDRLADVASQMRSQAYNQGVGVSADQAARNQAARNQFNLQRGAWQQGANQINQQSQLANQQLQFNTDLQAQLANQRAGLERGQQQLQAANMLQGIGAQGVSDVLAGNNMLLGNLQSGLQAGLLDQALRQQEINMDIGRWNFNQLAPYSTMEMYKSLIGMPGNVPWTGGENTGAGITASPGSTGQLGSAIFGLGSALSGGGGFSF